MGSTLKKQSINRRRIDNFLDKKLTVEFRIVKEWNI